MKKHFLTFPGFRFYFDNVDDIFDIKKGFIFLDKELGELFSELEQQDGSRFMDMLTRVFLSQISIRNSYEMKYETGIKYRLSHNRYDGRGIEMDGRTPYLIDWTRKTYQVKFRKAQSLQHPEAFRFSYQKRVNNA